MEITNEIVKALLNGRLNYPETILEEQGIDILLISEKEIWDKAEKILNEFEYVHSELDDYNLEQSYADCILYYKHKDKLYGIRYTESFSEIWDIEMEGEPFEVEAYTETVTKYRKL